MTAIIRFYPFTPCYINCRTISEPDDSLPIANVRGWLVYGAGSDIGYNWGDRNVIMTIKKTEFEANLRGPEH
jgi:hypothetical protein